MNEDEIRALQRQALKLNETLKKIAGERKTLLFGEFAKKYLSIKLANPTLRLSTKRSFSNQILNHLIPAFGTLLLPQIDNSLFLKWVSVEQCSSNGLRNFFNSRKYLIEILLAAKEEGHIEKLPKLDNPDEHRDVGRVLSDREVLRILLNTKSDQFRFFFGFFGKWAQDPKKYSAGNGRCFPGTSQKILGFTSLLEFLRPAEAAIFP